MSILKDIYTAINIVYKDSQIMSKLCFAQAILESNLLHKPSSLAIKYKNLFGIKGKGTNGSVLLPTTEYVNNKLIHVKDSFAVNKDYEASIQQHRNLMLHSRYSKVWLAKTFEESCKLIREAGYATDPAYPSKLIDNYNAGIREL